MKKTRFILLSFFLVGLHMSAYSQLATGQWKSHLSYINGQRLALSEHKVYCVASGNLFSYGLKDNAIETYSKTTGLSDISITDIGFCKALETLIICYENGNIDLLNKDGVINVPDLKNKAVYGSKAINRISIVGNSAYLCSDLGALKINIEKAEISETYTLSYDQQNPVNGIAVLDDIIYAATDNGLYFSNINNINLQNYSAWTKSDGLNDYNYGIADITTFSDHIIIAQRTSYGHAIKALETNGTWNTINKIGTFGGFGKNANRLLISCNSYIKVHDKHLNQFQHLSSYLFQRPDFPTQNKTRALHAIPISDNQFCIADSYSGLVIYNTAGSSYSYSPNGPGSNSIWDIDINDNIVRVVPGGTTKDINNIWRSGSISTYRDGKWEYINNFNGGEAYQEYVGVLSDPLDKEHFFVSSYSRGVLEYQDNVLINHYTENNSSIENAIPGDNKYVRTYGLAFDHNHNLWVSNSDTETQLHVKTDDGNWYPIKSNLTSPLLKYSKITVSSNNYKWTVTPYFGNGILVYDDNNTPDDTSDDRDKYFSIIARNNDGTLEEVSDDVETLEMDNNGNLWIGCNHGALFYSNPEAVFDVSGSPIASRVIRPRNDGTSNGDYLLYEERVQDIAVDGGNRKWLATQSSGVLLVSSDGLETIHHFTVDNSPLFSNNVKSVKINQETGEVFFGTNKGLISFQADASSPENDFSQLKVYPNPVRDDFFGDITITGLVEESNVKITDVSGNLVREVKSNGGTATWDGRNFYGERVGTGVYLIFCSDKKGERSGMTKVMLVN